MGADVPDEPTNSEIMRRLDELVRQVTEQGRQAADDRREMAQTYRRADVWREARKADQAAAADTASDVRILARKVEQGEDKRRAAGRVNIANGIALAGVIIALLALIINRGASL